VHKGAKKMILFDLPIYQFVMSIFVPSTLMTVLMKFITTLGSTIVLVTGILSVAILIKNKKYFKIFIIANVVGVILNNVLKLIIRRPRPTETMLLTYESSYSFPSGHSMMSMIFYGLIIYYVIKFINKKWLRNSLVTLLSLIIFSVGLSRIYLGVHYATDVIAGFIIGAVYLYIFTRIAEKKKA
jgi:undecaprenyl-diphosphatase